MTYAPGISGAVEAPVQPTEIPPRWRLPDLLCVFLLLIAFFILVRPTFNYPFYWDSSYAGDTIARLLQGSMNPAMKGFHDPGHPVLIPELYAVGWLVIKSHPVWWPRIVAFALCFLTLLYSYRIGSWLGGPLLGLVGASLIMIDPLFLAQSGATYVAAPSVGLATAALYYLLTGQHKKFAISGSLAALTYIPTDIFLCCLIAIGFLLHLRKGPRVVIWYLVPGFTLAAWLLFHRLTYGYFISDPGFYRGGQRSVALSPEHLHINIQEVFLRQWRLPFTILTFGGGLLLVLLWLFRKQLAAKKWTDGLYRRMGGDKSALLFLVLLAGTFLYLPVVTATSGAVMLGRYLLVLIVPLFLLAVRVLQATKVTWLWVLLCVLIGWNLRAHWYDPKEPWRANMEETLLYRRFVKAEVDATAFLTNHYPSATVLSAYPHYAELSLPFMAYVKRPMKVEQAATANPDTPVDLIYYSTVASPGEREKLFQVIDRQGARPIQRFANGDIKIVILKTGENLNLPENRYTGVLLNTLLQVPPNYVFDVSVAFQNFGRNVWPKPYAPWALQGDINVGYQWERDGKLLPGSFLTPFPHDYFWGETAVVKVLVHAPPQPGHYTLILDLVGPGDTWFATLGNTPLRVDVEVR